MQEVRRRKQKDNKPKKNVSAYAQKNTADDRVDVVTEAAVKTEIAVQNNGWLWTILYISFGLAMAGVLGYRYAAFVKLMHENDMWFSEISVS